MFARFKPYFSNMFSDVSTNFSENKVNSSTWVYIWNMTPQGVGHAAVQVGGEAPKLLDEQPGEYVSIHPKNIPAMGPTVVLPLPATLATTLKSDMLSEAASHSSQNSDMGNILSELSLKESPPDQTIKIDGLNTSAMKTFIDSTRRDIESGESAYQLLPKVNMLGFFYRNMLDASTFVNQDPIDVAINQMQHHRDEVQEKKRYNCTMLVSDVLNSGGMHIQPSRLPWGLTPNDLAKQIEREKRRM